MSLRRKLVKISLFLSCPLSLMAMEKPAMEKLNEKDRSELQNRIKQIEFAQQVGPTYFMGSGQSMSSFIGSQIDIIENILDKNSIPHPKEKTFGWLNSLKGQLEPAKETISEAPESNTVDISGLPKEAILKALFEAARPGGFWPSKTKLTQEDIQNALNHLSNIDYLGGKPLKVDLSGDTFDAFFYNRDNGERAAQKTIKKLRESLGK